MFAKKVKNIKENSIILTAAALFYLVLITISKLDHNPFCGDESCYGYDAVDLYYSLQQGLSKWVIKMILISPEKPPGIVWLGQLFVPFGLFFGSIDKALIFTTSIFLFLSAGLICISLNKICDGKKYCGLVGMLLMMSSPMLLTSSFTYLTEPLQLLCVVLFVFVMAYSESINSILKTFLLFGLIALAFISKVNTMAFCVAPSLIITYSIFKNLAFNKEKYRLSIWNFIQIISIILICGASILWYYYNYQTVLAHLKLAYAGDVAAVWGIKAPFKETFSYWCRVSSSELMLQATAICTIVFIITGIITRVISGPKKFTFFDICLIASLLQILFVGILFGMASNRVTRYLLPVLPYFSIVVAWGFRWMPLRYIRVGFIIYLLVSIALEYAIITGLHIFPLQESIPIRKISNNSNNIDFLNKILDDTKCTHRSTVQGCVVAIDPLFRGDWLAPAPLNYYGFCNYFGNNKTVYYYSGNNFFGSSAEDAINFIKSDIIESVVICDPNIYEPQDNYINKSLKGKELTKLIDFLKTSPIYRFRGHIGEDHGILLFKKNTINQLKKQ